MFFSSSADPEKGWQQYSAYSAEKCANHTFTNSKYPIVTELVLQNAGSTSYGNVFIDDVGLYESIQI